MEFEKGFMGNIEKSIERNPKISIIIPAYNVENYLEKCLTSLIKQTLKDIEIIVIDDGSTDRTNAIMQEFAKQDKRIKTITQTNQKQGAARNRGLEIAKGEYISFVDSDDWVDLDYFEKLYDAVVKNSVNMAVASMTRDKKGKQKCHLKVSIGEVYHGVENILFAIDRHIETAGKLYKFEPIKDLRFEENTLYEDGGYSIRAINILDSMVTVGNTCYHYVSNPVSTIKQKSSSKNDIDKILTSLDVINYAEEKGIKIKEFPIIKENHFWYAIKHYKYRKDFYLFGIKIFSKKQLYNDINTFLVFNTSCFGDVLLCNSLCQNIKRVFPNAKLVFICDKPFYEVAKYQKGVDDVVIYDKCGEHKGLLGFWKFMRNFEYKNAFASFVTYRNVRNMAVSKFSGAKYIIQARKLQAGLSTQDKHNYWLKILTRRKVENLPIRYEVEEGLPEKLMKFFGTGKKYIGLCTVSKLERKDMPLETAIRLINKINTETDYSIVFLGAGEKAIKYAENLQQAGCKFVNLVNKTSIYDLGRVLKRCEHLVSVDTGILHMGCAVNVPLTAVFYKEDYIEEWAPREDLYNVRLISQEQTSENIYKRVFE